MIINMVGGGGGAALNFKVVPGLTQPGTASENTIWVKTERIGAWYFSVTQPENMQELDVWFPTGAKSDFAFNALRKNAVQVYPLIAKQMVGGVLADIDAMSYQNGEWVDWFSGLLYEQGDEFEHITGGWDVSDYLISGYTFAAPVFTKTAATMTLTNVSAQNRCASISHKNALDLSGFEKVCINITALGGVDRRMVAVVPEGSTYIDSEAVAQSNGVGTNLGHFELPFGNIDTTKKYFIVIATSSGSNGYGSITVDRIWLA